ncbi:hypothetical protein JBE04_20455 [Streptomyces sp. PRKS01-29]|nr:hypothetical protein [Streptomyces sabulosicollis]MBI0296766.1 hypothetical protein [Streptomyces sabulosicollis]
MTTPTTPRPIAALDVPLEQVAADATRLRLTEGALAEQRHLIDPLDHDYEQMPCTNPDACSCNADYPGWTPGRTA